MIRPARRIRFLAAAGLIGAMLADLSCATTTVCRDSGGSGVTQSCVELGLKRGDEIWVHVRDGEVHHGFYIGSRNMNGAPTVYLHPSSLEPGIQRSETTRVEMSEIRSINRIHDTPGFVAGFLIGGFVAAFGFLILLSGSLGME